MNLRLNSYGLLSPGVHRHSVKEVIEVFGRSNHQRRNLADGLYAGVESLRAASVEVIVIGGSFITAKPEPRDVDGCWLYTPKVDIGKLDPVFLAETSASKAKFLMDFTIDGVRVVPTGQYLTRYEKLTISREFQPAGVVLLTD